MSDPSHPLKEPSEWVVRWAPRVERGPVLDLACGGGRHSRFFRDRGFNVVAVDRDRADMEGISFLQADLENGSGWPLGDERFGAIVVTNYLHRPLFPHIRAALAPRAVLIYETFMAGNERFGRPSNPQFLLGPGELRKAFAELEELGFEEGEVEKPKRAVIQRICALKR